MPFPFQDLSAPAIIPAAEQIIANLVHLEAAPNEAKLFELVTKVKADNTTVINSLQKKRSGEYTCEIAELVEILKEDFELFRDTAELRARKANANRERKEDISHNAFACVAIAELIQRHGRTVYHLSRPELIGQLASLIDELNMPEYYEFLTAGDLINEFMRFSESYQNLNHLLHLSSEQESAKNQIPSPGRARDALAVSLKDLHKFITIFARIGNEEYISILDKTEETLEKFRPLLNSKHKQSEDSEESAKIEIESTGADSDE